MERVGPRAGRRDDAHERVAGCGIDCRVGRIGERRRRAGAGADAAAARAAAHRRGDRLTGCSSVEKPLSAGGASIVPEVGGQQKNWQPPGGEITFTVRSFVPIPADALVLVCFRWKRSGEKQDNFITARPTHLDLTDAGRTLRVTVVVPDRLGKAPARFSGDGEYAGLYLVPLAEVRILVVDKGADGNFAIAADVSHVIGVANPFWALLLAVLTVLAGVRRAQPDQSPPAEAARARRPRPGHPHHHDAGRLREPVAVPDGAVDLRGRGLGGLRDGAVGRADRGDHRNAGAARHFRRRHGRHATARQPRDRRRSRFARAHPAAQADVVRPHRQRGRTAGARSISRACRCSTSP